jgi:hypothetical protein
MIWNDKMGGKPFLWIKGNGVNWHDFIPDHAEGGCMAMVIALVLIVLLIVALAFDVFVIMFDVPQHTVSYHMWQMMRQHPGFTLLIGVAIGHIFLPMVIPNAK